MLASHPPHQKPSQKSWRPLLAEAATEFPLTPLPILSGQVPSDLQGSLYRNGPARFRRGSQRVGHWFDGDGALLAVHLQPHGVSATYRFVQTPQWQAEERQQRFLYGNYGRRGLRVKNAANTSVLALDDQVWALCEAGSPFALGATHLETLGAVQRFAGPYSAHPKRDPQTGDIFNFGVAYGRQTHLHLYHHDPQGQIQRQQRLALPYPTLIHDCILAPPYLLVMVPPLTIDVIAVLLQLKTYSQACTWTPHLGCRWLVFEADTLELVQTLSGDPCFAWHFGRAQVNGTQITVEGCFYDDFGSNEYLAQVVSGAIHRDPQGYFGRVTLDLSRKRVSAPEIILPRTCDFPTVSPTATYVGVHRQGSRFLPDLFSGLARWDGQHWQETQWDEGIYPSEAIPVGDWLLTVVWKGHRHGAAPTGQGSTGGSELWILDAHDLTRDPVCRLGLPHPIPPSFHGTWRAATATSTA
ncbi:MAG: carotenoid oxygenase family protein [Synechococcales cyanobacterium]